MELEATEDILWRAEIMRRFGSETGTKRNIAHRAPEIISSEIEILKEELCCACDPKSEIRIKEMIDERLLLIAEAA